jgi:hypothetical protein
MEGGGASIAYASVPLWRIDYPEARQFPADPLSML